MPERDGYWFVREVLGQPVEPGRTPLPVIAITAHGEVHGPDRTLVAGFQAHIRKPIEPWELCRLVASLSRRL
jgi:CheY-like chemotaxis protein